MRRSGGRIRRLLLAAGVLALVAGPVEVARADASAPAAFVPGSGSASGSVAQARLFYGGLSLPLGIGTTSASYTNQQSRALGVALDLGAYVSLVADVPPELAPTVVDSNAGDAETHADLGAGTIAARVDLRATQVPAASSEVRMTDVDLPALVRIEGAHAASSTEVHEGRERRSSSLVEVARTTIAEVVVIEDMRWEAVQRSGLEPVADASFTLGRITIAGLPVPAGADASSALAAVNAALAPIGLQVEAPVASQTTAGTVVMSPFRVALADSPLGAELLGPIIASARPVLAPAFEAATDVDSSLGLLGLVADLVLGVADGSGGVEVAIGGVTASTDEVGFVAPSPPGEAAEPIEGAPAAPSQPDGDTTPPLSAGSSGAVPSATGTSPTTLPAAAPTELAAGIDVATSVRCALEAAPRRSGACRDSSPAMALGISGVAVALAVAAELRVRRRRQDGVSA